MERCRLSIKLALNVYQNQPLIWQKLIKTAMQQDFSWKTASVGYEKLYQQLLIE